MRAAPFMLKALLQFALVAALATSSTGCRKKGATTNAAPGTLTEAQRADLLNKARENYKKLVEKYPDSPYAAQAQERLSALPPAPRR